MRCSSRLARAVALRSTDCKASPIVTSLVACKAAVSSMLAPPQHPRAPTASTLPAPAPRLASLRPALRSHATSAASSAAADPLCPPQSASGQIDSRQAEQLLHSGLTRVVQLSSTVRPPLGCQAPLCERSEQHVASASALHDWRQAAIAAIEEVGDAHAAGDGGSTVAELKARPSTWITQVARSFAVDAFSALARPVSAPLRISVEDAGLWLQRELGWLLEDAIAAERTDSRSSWRTASWRSVELLLDGIFAASSRRTQSHGQAEVLMRASLHDLQELWRQRLQERVPLQYLTASAHWRDMVLAVGPGALIPRPETEQLVDLASAAVRESPDLSMGHWLDLGTGSGALALGLVSVLSPSAQVTAVDASEDAAAWAMYNVARTGMGNKVRVAVGSWYDPVGALTGSVAGIVSNPPYIRRSDLRGLQPEVRRHEPCSALDGGDGGGTESLDRVCTGAVPMLRPGGFLALETAGGSQAHQVVDFLAALDTTLSGGDSAGLDLAGDRQPSQCADSRTPAAAFTRIQVVPDMFGVDRFVTARRT